MNKQAISSALTNHHRSFIDYINELTPEDYLYSHEEKWTAGQQVAHMVLCVKPLVQVFSMDKATIRQNFGQPAGPGRSYEDLKAKYKEKVKEGGKAPDRFVPEAVSADQKELLGESLAKLIGDLCAKMERLTEAELDELCIPHPLLGNLSMREMLLNAVHHVQHHHEQTRQNLMRT